MEPTVIIISLSHDYLMGPQQIEYVKIEALETDLLVYGTIGRITQCRRNEIWPILRAKMILFTRKINELSYILPNFLVQIGNKKPLRINGAGDETLYLRYIKDYIRYDFDKWLCALPPPIVKPVLTVGRTNHVVGLEPLPSTPRPYDHGLPFAGLAPPFSFEVDIIDM